MHFVSFRPVMSFDCFVCFITMCGWVLAQCVNDPDMAASLSRILSAVAKFHFNNSMNSLRGSR